MIRTPHDRLFKATFSQPQYAAELLRSVLPAAVTRHIDFTTLHSHATHLPVVIPIVLHHGEDGWSEPVSLRELYDAPAAVLDDLRPYIPELTFVLDDLAPQSDAVLRARAVSAVPKLVLWALKHVRHGRDVIPALRDALDLVRGVLLATNGVAALLTVLRYIIDVSDSSEKELMKPWSAPCSRTHARLS